MYERALTGKRMHGSVVRAVGGFSVDGCVHRAQTGKHVRICCHVDAQAGSGSPCCGVYLLFDDPDLRLGEVVTCDNPDNGIRTVDDRTCANDAGHIIGCSGQKLCLVLVEAIGCEALAIVLFVCIMDSRSIIVGNAAKTISLIRILYILRFGSVLGFLSGLAPRRTATEKRSGQKKTADGNRPVLVQKGSPRA